MATKSASIKAIEITRAVFESIHGNIGLLRFNIEELIPTNGSNGLESKKWDVVCSFFETLGSASPSRYKVSVNLIDGTVTLKKISTPSVEAPEQRFTFTPEPATPPEAPTTGTGG